MYNENKRCPICESNDITNISVMDFDGNARLHSFDLRFDYICACKKCGIVFVPKCFLPNEQKNVKRRIEQ